MRFKVAQFIGFHDALTSLNASNIRFSAKGAIKLMENIDQNYNLDSLQCHDCSEYQYPFTIEYRFSNSIN